MFEGCGLLRDTAMEIAVDRLWGRDGCTIPCGYAKSNGSERICGEDDEIYHRA